MPNGGTIYAIAAEGIALVKIGSTRKTVTDLNPRIVGKRLRDSRQARGLSQTQVAFAADINLGNYNEIEHGKRQSFQVKTLYRLCQVLGVSADALLGLPALSGEEPTP